ncbi:MAG: Hsp20/alpha crystallin family protein [Desulfarculales bacterium]|jgi:HSP20 family molecular chaperone IbpA|nr:Hsp20/alpha crystallin family protein [Desulfarculales bacterium]
MSETLHKAGEVSGLAEQVSSLPLLTPLVDISENEKELILTADLPGVKEEDLNLKLENDILTLEGVFNPDENEGDLLLREFGGGRYYRQFTLGQSIDRAAIVATLKGGELVLTLPKAQAAQPRRISVTGA